MRISKHCIASNFLLSLMTFGAVSAYAIMPNELGQALKIQKVSASSYAAASVAPNAHPLFSSPVRINIRGLRNPFLIDRIGSENPYIETIVDSGQLPVGYYALSVEGFGSYGRFFNRDGKLRQRTQGKNAPLCVARGGANDIIVIRGSDFNIGPDGFMLAGNASLDFLYTNPSQFEGAVDYKDQTGRIMQWTSNVPRDQVAAIALKPIEEQARAKNAG